MEVTAQVLISKEPTGRSPTLKTALVIHPYLSIYAGGELVCLRVINALAKAGYRVILFSDVADAGEAERYYPEAGKALAQAEHIALQIKKRITPLPGMRMLDTARSERTIFRALEGLNPDVAFSTQSSIFTMKPPTRLIHFTYDFNDLFVYSPFTRIREARPDLERSKLYAETYKTGKFLIRKLVRSMLGIVLPRPDVIATPSSIIFRLLRDHGYSNSTTFIPPCRQYPPKPKVRQVIQVARLVQTKRIELFFEAASRMPGERFVLIARKDEGAVSYGNRLLSHIPPNVELVNGNLNDHVQRLQESSVYCYTGRDRAIMLTVAEAISAGCYPVVARDSSALDVAKIAKVGSSFYSMDELIQKLQTALDSPGDPFTISRFAEPFKPEHFEHWVQNVASTSIFPGIEVTQPAS